VNSGPADEPAAIELFANNFESFVSRCFQGETCVFAEDPTAIYEHFRLTGNRKAMDQLLSVLRLRMQDSADRARYGETLKTMIENFYPPEEKQFQLAAFYNYAGDLERSLALYLDLEKKAATNPALRGAPKLNIANTLYDLGRKKESLPYYVAAKSDFEAAPAGGIPSNNEMLGFIETRISEVSSL
jgi:tetratricopeptide (TPR) repeat protein